MRLLMIAATATLLTLPAAGQASDCAAAQPSAQVATTEYSADEAKKPVKKCTRSCASILRKKRKWNTYARRR